MTTDAPLSSNLSKNVLHLLFIIYCAQKYEISSLFLRIFAHKIKEPLMIKALFFDIDGTLVSFKTHEIPVSLLKR